MEFTYDGETYRIAFKHEVSTNWVDHHGHAVRLARGVKNENHSKGPAILFCTDCQLQLSHIPKRQQGQRRVWCTIYRRAEEADAPDADRWIKTEWQGVARLNLKKGDQYTREKGRCAALTNALDSRMESIDPAPREFRTAAWKAYHQRQRMKTRTA